MRLLVWPSEEGPPLSSAWRDEVKVCGPSSERGCPLSFACGPRPVWPFVAFLDRGRPPDQGCCRICPCFSGETGSGLLLGTEKEKALQLAAAGDTLGNKLSERSQIRTSAIPATPGKCQGGRKVCVAMSVSEPFEFTGNGAPRDRNYIG